MNDVLNSDTAGGTHATHAGERLLAATSWLGNVLVNKILGGHDVKSRDHHGRSHVVKPYMERTGL